MRAATNIGLIFVGSAQHREQRTEENDFKPRVIPPNKDRETMRLAYAKALAEKAEFWKKEFENLATIYGEDAVEELKQSMNKTM